MNAGFNLAILHSSGNVDSFIDEFIIFLKEELLLHGPSETLLVFCLF